MTSVEQEQTIQLSEEQRSLLDTTLHASFLAAQGLHDASEQVAGLDKAAEVIVALQGLAKATLERSEQRVSSAGRESHTALQDILAKQSVDTDSVLDIWFRYRSRLHTIGGDVGTAQEKQDQDWRDREALASLLPGTKIIDLHGVSFGSATADVVVTQPKLVLGNKRDGKLRLRVMFETEATKAKEKEDNDRTAHLHPTERGISEHLDGLANRLLVGEEAINEYFETYEPVVLGSDQSTHYDMDVYDASESINYIDALVEHGLAEDNADAIGLMKAAVIKNCLTLLGIEEGGELTGPNDEHDSSRFLEAVKRFNPAVYAVMCDAIGIAIYEKTYRWPERYANLIASVETGKTWHQLSFEEESIAYTELKARGQKLAEAKV